MGIHAAIWWQKLATQMKDHNSKTVMIFYLVPFSVGRWLHGFRICFETFFYWNITKLLITFTIEAYTNMSMFLCKIQHMTMVTFGIYSRGINIWNPLTIWCFPTTCGEMHHQENESHSTEQEEFKTHPRLLISHLIDVVFVLFVWSVWNTQVSFSPIVISNACHF